MKKILLLILSVSGLFSSVFVKAQSFSVQADTVWATASTSGLTHIADTISVASGSASLKWKVKESNFPADWQVDTVLGICDAFICRQNTGGSLWNGTSGTYYTCMYPGTGNSHDFHFQLDMYPSGSPSSVSSGTHYITILVNDPITTDARTMTFIVTKPYPAAVTNVNTNQNDVVMYPNPARDELNVVYSANADVKTIGFTTSSVR